MKFTYICILMITNLYPDDIQLLKNNKYSIHVVIS